MKALSIVFFLSAVLCSSLSLAIIYLNPSTLPFMIIAIVSAVVAVAYLDIFNLTKRSK